MKTYKQLLEGINETLSFLEEENLFEGPTHLEYSGHVGEKEYAVKVPRHKDLGDYSEKELHHKISKENPHLHHHEVTAIVNSGGEEESHEKVEHEGKTHTHHVINYQEPRHLYEELDEANENFDSNSKAHQAAKKAVKGWRGLSKATYHSDGSATINTKERTKNRYGKEGHYSGLETTHSHSVVDQTLKHAGGMHNHSRDELDNHKQKIDGLHWKVKGKQVRGVGGTHEIHIHEEVDGLQELSKDTLKSYTTKRTMGVDPSGSTNPNTISSMKQKAKANSTLGNDAEAARLRTKVKNSGMGTAKAYARMGDKGMPGSAVDKAAKKMPSSYRSEEVEQTDEALKGNQHKIDANKNGKVDGHDFKILRNAKKARYQ